MQIYAPGTEIGQYRILSKPMMGGMGVVYACHDLQNDRAVALKTFKPEYLPDRAARDRFLREGTAWVELGKHPHIVRCHEVKYFDPTAFLVLELVIKDEGRDDASLRSWLGQPLPLETALLFTLQIARGLAHATKKLLGFVHRDLKPENVLVGSDKLPGMDVNRLRVTDFGLITMLSVSDQLPITNNEEAGNASVLHRTHLTRGIMGTPLYMAPEQWLGEPVGVYTDVYALGCILYEMLTGQRAASGYSIADLRAAHCEGRLRPIPPNLPGDVADFLARCLARDVSERFQNWEAVLSALEAACAGQGLSLAILEDEITSQAEQRDLASSYNEMGTSYSHMGNPRVAAGYYEKALGIQREIGDRRGEGAVLGNLGLAYADLGDARRAIGYYEEGLKIDREIGDRRGEGASLGNLGSAYYSLGDARRAIGYYEAQLTIVREIGDRRGQGASLGNLGVAYATLGDAGHAIGYYEAQLTIVREIGDRRGQGVALGNLGSAYYSLGDAQRATGYYEERLVIAREIGDRRGEGYALGNLGNAYLNLGDARRAIGYYEEAIVIRREIGDLNGVAIDSFNMANLYCQQGETARAIPLVQEAERIFTQVGSPNAQKARQRLAQLQGGAPHPETANPAQAAFEAFQCAGRIQDIQAALAAHPILKDPEFHTAIEQIIREQAPPEMKPAFEERLALLKQLTQFP